MSKSMFFLTQAYGFKQLLLFYKNNNLFAYNYLVLSDHVLYENFI